MNTISASSVDGQTYVVELHRVTGLEALLYRRATGEELDFRIGAIIGSAAADMDAPLADVAVVKWLWVRQSGRPDASLAEVAASVTLFPAPDPVGDAAAEGPS